MTSSWAALKGASGRVICAVATQSSSYTFTRFYSGNDSLVYPVALAVLTTTTVPSLALLIQCLEQHLWRSVRMK